MAGDKQYSNITGRLVRGDLFTGNDKNKEGGPRISKSGQPITSFFITVAIRKDDPCLAKFFGMVSFVGERDFPSGQSKQPGFKSKIQDGDLLHNDRTGQQVPWPEWGHGHYIVNMEQVNQPIHTVDQNNAPIVDRNLIKNGDYVMVSVGVRGNDNQGLNAGLYLDPSIVKLIGYGEAIITRPDAATVFGEAPVALPPGASATPVAAVGAMPATAQVMGNYQQPIPADAPAYQPPPAAAPGTSPPVGVPGAQLGNPSPPVATSPAAPVGIPPTGAAPLPGGATASPSNVPGAAAPNPNFLVPQS